MDLSACLHRRWLHSHEEDTGEFEVYRPADHPFPPARGRRGLEFRENGEVVHLALGRADVPQPVAGVWRAEAPDRVTVELADRPAQTLEIAYCDDNVLKIRK
jgi:hypothetical protein